MRTYAHWKQIAVDNLFLVLELSYFVAMLSNINVALGIIIAAVCVVVDFIASMKWRSSKQRSVTPSIWIGRVVFNFAIVWLGLWSYYTFGGFRARIFSSRELVWGSTMIAVGFEVVRLAFLASVMLLDKLKRKKRT